MSQRRGQARNSQRKLAEIRRQRQTRLRILAGAAVLAAVALVVVAAITFTDRRRTAQGVRATPTGATVDGIACQTS
jgi:hypothetical protein